MSPTVWKAPVAIVVGLAAVGTLVAADVLGWPIGIASAGLLGSLAGMVGGYLVPSPSETQAVIKAIAAKAGPE